jgi:hypothetical protein
MRRGELDIVVKEGSLRVYASSSSLIDGCNRYSVLNSTEQEFPAPRSSKVWSGSRRSLEISSVQLERSLQIARGSKTAKSYSLSPLTGRCLE